MRTIIIVINVVNSVCLARVRFRGRPRVLPEKRRRRRRRATRLRGSICCNRRRRNESTGATASSGRGPPWPPRRLRPSTVPWLRGAGGPTGATVGPRPPDPPPSAIGRPIELFVHPAAASIHAGRHHFSARASLSLALSLYCCCYYYYSFHALLCCSFTSTPLVRRRHRRHRRHCTAVSFSQIRISII